MDYMGYDSMTMAVCLMVGKQAGVIGILTTLAKKIDILAIVAYDENVEMISKELHIPTFNTIYDKEFVEHLAKSDLLISIHGKEIVPENLLSLPKIGCINVHPCLYKYKGRDPIIKLLKDGETKASVGVHWMTGSIDSGQVIAEEFVDVTGLKNVTDVYNALYPYYSFVLLKTLGLINNQNVKEDCT